MRGVWNLPFVSDACLLFKLSSFYVRKTLDLFTMLGRLTAKPSITEETRVELLT